MVDTSILVIDIGNTHIVMGIYIDGELKHSWRFLSDVKRTADEYFGLILSLKESYSLKIAHFTTCVLASVVPELTRIFTHMITKYFPGHLITVNSKTPMGLRFLVPDPSFIGADLLVNAYIAKEKYKANCIVCDFGTATTLQLVGADGTFYGAVISPGVMTSASTLFTKAALLSSIELENPQTILGTNTKDALLSGIIKGHAHMVDGLIREIRDEYACIGSMMTIATGGIAPLICQQSCNIDIQDKTLTLEGLYRIGVSSL